MTATVSSVPNPETAAAAAREAGVETRYQLKSVGRAFRLLEILADNGDGGLTVTECAAELEASKSATFAMLQTLVNLNYVTVASRGPRYGLGPAVLRLADSHSRSSTLIAAVRPIMQSLTHATGWTSRLAIHEDGFPVFVDRVDGSGTIRFFTPLGQREEPHHSAAGKAIIAELSETRVRAIAHETGLPGHTRHTITDVTSLLADLALVRSRGFAIDDEEDDHGVICVGATFSGRDGLPAGAVSITGLKADVPGWKVQELGQSVRAHADEMSLAIGGQPWRPPSILETNR